MKKIWILGLCFMLTASFAGCSGSETSSMTDSSDKKPSSSSTLLESSDKTDSSDKSNTHSADDTGNVDDVVGDDDDLDLNDDDDTKYDLEALRGKLRDGKYTAEGKKYDSDGYRPVATVTVKSGKITDIKLDAINKKGESKRDTDDAGWVEKMMLFEKEAVAKGLAEIDLSRDGTVNGITGFDLNIGEYTPLINEAIDEAEED